ncbi:MAG: hypothetical protein D6742_03795 [Cyanobacteria bacterium J069]|nr:MAG: hypothetical protein D6742_03795 [Cyanobacteria bacterium J069]
MAQSFTIPGFRVKQIVPDLLPTVPRPQPSGKRDRSQPVSAEPLLVDDALNQSPWDNKIELPDSAPQQEPPPASLSDLSIEVNLAEASAAEQTTVAAGVEAIAEDIRSEDIRSEDTNQGLDAIAAEGLGVASERLEGDDNAWNVFSLEEAELSLSEAAPPDSEDVEALVTEALEAVAAEWSDADLPGLPDLPDAELSPERLESATELPVEAEPPVEAESVANGDRLSEATDPGHSEKPSGESSNSTETEMSDQPPIEEQ